MQVDPKLIKNRFEKSLETYNQNAVVQQIMAEKLIYELSNICDRFSNVLELGSGTGLLTNQFVKKISFEKYYANDLVEKSKKYITEIIPNVNFYTGNAQKIKPVQKMDLIISNAMFQWLKNLDKAVNHYKTVLNPSGILAFSTFSKENFKEIHDICGLALEYKTSDEIKEILEKDFDVLYFEEFVKILEFSNPLELLAHMKNTGVNSLTSKHLTFKEAKEFCDSYRKKYPQIILTYAPVIVICRKKK